jgi:diaminohydroxyphosphoribosylaminopyrimidine deaminase / 5-amino-6-(5-phosphoribosylamino)uracil reductase
MTPIEIFSPQDAIYMQQALHCAAQAIGLSDPNPRVGCVITSPEGKIIGRGHTQQAGGPHAEIMALRDAAAQGESVVGATVFVTLEPCAHQGRTPPCTQALVAAGIKKVIAAVQDPNPLVAGQGFAQLRAVGVMVQVGLHEQEAIELNIGFFSRMQRARPWVRLKSAISLDGRTALPNGVSQWITGPAARTDGHAWRKRAGALLTGVGTVLQDNPRLDVRLNTTQYQPLRVIIDSHLRTPANARILAPPGQVIIYSANPEVDHVQALQAQGIEVIQYPTLNGRVDLGAVLTDLAQRSVNELHIEAGHQLGGAFVQAGLVDEYLIYLAPKLLGNGLALAALPELNQLQNAVPLTFQSVEKIGDDLRILVRPFT